MAAAVEGDTFDGLRPRLHAIAYRMLGSVAEAEEVVQDTWLRWHAAARDTLASAEAWLVSVATRLAIDRLRAAKLQREHYPGLWLPEPLLDEATPERELERAGQLSIAFLLVLERLTADERAAFLLREVFDADYADIAETLDKSEAACRQLVHRAKAQLRGDRPRRAVPADTHLHLLRGFAQAMASGDFGTLKAMLAESAELIGDGGGKVPSFGRPLPGGRRIAQLFYAATRRHPGAVQVALARFNGAWGLLRSIDGVLESAQAIEFDETGRIVRLLVQRNPDKLARLAAACGVRAAEPVFRSAPG